VNDIQFLTKAMNFAAQKHVNERRKGERQEPYINHLTEVSEMLAANGASLETIVAGILHDTIEDTETAHEELVREFGENVADIVKEVSDDQTLPWQERNRLQIEHALHASDAAKQVKMADKISNLCAILRTPPVGWSVKRKLEYFNFSKKVVDNCRGVNPGLEACFDDVYKRGIKALKLAA